MRRFRLVSMLMAGLAVVMVIGCGGSSADLKLNLKQGETYRTRIVTEQVISQAGRGQSESVSQKITQDMACELQETDSQGNLHVKVTFERMAEEMARGTMKQIYDSADPNNSNMPTAMKYSPFVGHTLTLVVSDRGEMAEITGIDSLIDRILGVMDIQVDSLRDQMRILLQGDYSRQLSNELCDKLFGVLPAGPVKVGDSWNCATEGKIVIPLTWQHALKLTAMNKGIATLTDSASTSIDTQDNPEDMGMVTIARVASGSQNGTLDIDAATGMIVGGTLTGALKGEQHIVDGPEQIKGQTIPLDVTQTVTWEKL